MPTPSNDWYLGLAAGVADDKPKSEHSADWLAGYEMGSDIRRGHADGRAGRLPDGAQSRAWEIGFDAAQKK